MESESAPSARPRISGAAEATTSVVCIVAKLVIPKPASQSRPSETR